MRPALMKEWMNALLSLVNHQQILFFEGAFFRNSRWRKEACALKAEITGELIDPLRHVFRCPPASLRLSKVVFTSQGSSANGTTYFFTYPKAIHFKRFS